MEEGGDGVCMLMGVWRQSVSCGGEICVSYSFGWEDCVREWGAGMTEALIRVSAARAVGFC